MLVVLILVVVLVVLRYWRFGFRLIAGLFGFVWWCFAVVAVSGMLCTCLFGWITLIVLIFDGSLIVLILWLLFVVLRMFCFCMFVLLRCWVLLFVWFGIMLNVDCVWSFFVAFVGVFWVCLECVGGCLFLCALLVGWLA